MRNLQNLSRAITLDKIKKNETLDIRLESPHSSHFRNVYVYVVTTSIDVARANSKFKP